MWQEELKKALTFGTNHMSLYQLTIEEGTAFYHQFHRGKFTLPNDELAAALFYETQDIMSAAGLPAYETSNHAKPGQESLHNLAYWLGNYYVGIGPGAHGRLPAHAHGDAYAHSQTKRPEDWLKAVVSRGTGLETLEYIPAKDRALEAILTGLRLTRGITIKDWQAQFGQDINTLINPQALSELRTSGHVSNNKEKLQLTRKGLPLLNFILGKLIA